MPYVGSNIKKKKKNNIANLFANIETMDNGHWKFHK